MYMYKTIQLKRLPRSQDQKQIVFYGMNVCKGKKRDGEWMERRIDSKREFINN